MAVTVIVLVLILVASVGVFIAQTMRGNEQRHADQQDKVLTEFEGIRLTNTHLIDGYGPDAVRIPLHSAGTLITDHGSVTSRVTATRLATLGIVGFALPKVTDTRSSFLIVAGQRDDGTQWHTTRTIKAQKSRPAALQRAHSFADLVNASAQRLRVASVAEAARKPAQPARSLGLRRPQAH